MVLALLGLNPNALAAVQIEQTAVLPVAGLWSYGPSHSLEWLQQPIEARTVDRLR